MCKPACCNNSSGNGGIAIAAILAVLAAAAIIGKLRPFFHQAARIAAEVFQFLIMAALAATICAVATVVIVTVLRWRAKHPRKTSQPQASCPACEGTGEVLWAGHDGQFQLTTCAGCQPANQAR
jgi:membrane protein implicated in regulation of membrane protease activity